MSVTLNNSDFQCLQDQLLDLKTKNYELAEKSLRSQADFEAAKAKICALQLKLEEQERDFQVTSTTLRREIEAVTSANEANKGNNDGEGYEAKCKELLHAAKELQERYEKSVELVQQFDVQNKKLNDKLHNYEEEITKLKEKVESKQKQLIVIEKECKKKLKVAAEEHKSMLNDERQNYSTSLDGLKAERDNLSKEVEKLAAEVNNFDSRLESQAEERKIQERKGLKIVKELKRQLALEKNRSETLQQRLENLLRELPSSTQPSSVDLEGRSRLSTSSSTNGTSSNGNSSNGGAGGGTGGSNANQDANSTGSWSFVPIKTKQLSNQALNETLSLCSIDSDDRETVQQPCDTVSEDSSMQRVVTSSIPYNVSRQDSSSTSTSAGSPLKQANSTSSQTQAQQTPNQEDEFRQQQQSVYFNSPAYSLSGQSVGDGMLIEEQAALVDRLTRLQHDKWMLEEKLSYMEQANSSLSEDLANKSDIIKNYFMEQALKATAHSNHHTDVSWGNSGSFLSNNNNASSRRTSFPNNVNHLLLEKPSLKKVVDFLKERSQVLPTAESENISREATKKMQLMLEETLIKCLKLQENLDFVTSELNRLKS